MSNDLQRIRKEQVHSPAYKSWNYRGSDGFSSFNPSRVLAGDNWECNAEEMVWLDNDQVFVRFGDIVIAMVNSPGEFTKANIDAGKWKIFRNLTNDEIQKIIDLQGEVLAMKAELTIAIDMNFVVSSQYLTIAAFADTPFKTNDNVNMYVNGQKYTTNVFTFQPDNNVIVWIPSNSKFDLIEGDYCEIEVFRYVTLT